MTIATAYFNWARSGLDWDAPPYEQDSPNLRALLRFLDEQFGQGLNLGIHYDRSIRAGTTISTHAYGAAADWRYENPGPGRAVLLADILPFLINWSKELGISAIHDYVGNRVWHAGRTPNVADAHGAWWRTQTGSSDPNMGKPWAQWIHIEVHRDAWADGRPVLEKVGLAGGPTENPIPITPTPGRNIVQGPKATLSSKNRAALRAAAESREDVELFQTLVRGLGIRHPEVAEFQIGAIDGDYGPRSEAACRLLQALTGFDPNPARRLTVDGVCGPKTWARLLNLD